MFINPKDSSKILRAELGHLIQQAEDRLANANTELEWEQASAELEKLKAELAGDFSNDEGTLTPDEFLNNLRTSGL